MYIDNVDENTIIIDSTYEDDKDTGYVYIIETKHGYKIGQTKDWRKRINQIDNAMPINIDRKIIIKCNQYKSKEKVLHYTLTDKRIKGEWFLLSESDIEYIIDIEKSENEIRGILPAGIDDIHHMEFTTQKECCNRLITISSTIVSYISSGKHRKKLPYFYNAVIRLADVCAHRDKIPNVARYYAYRLALFREASKVFLNIYGDPLIIKNSIGVRNDNLLDWRRISKRDQNRLKEELSKNSTNTDKMDHCSYIFAIVEDKKLIDIPVTIWNYDDKSTEFLKVKRWALLPDDISLDWCY